MSTRALASNFFSNQPATHEGSCGLSDEESLSLKVFIANRIREWGCTNDVRHFVEIGCGTGRFSAFWAGLFPGLGRASLVEPQRHFLDVALASVSTIPRLSVQGYQLDVESLLQQQVGAPSSLATILHKGSGDLVILSGLCLYLSDPTITHTLATALSRGSQVLLLEDFSINFLAGVAVPPSACVGIPCQVPVLGDHLSLGADVVSGRGSAQVTFRSEVDLGPPADGSSAPLPVELVFSEDGSLVRSRGHFDELIQAAGREAGFEPSIRFDVCGNVHPDLYSPIGMWLISPPQ